MTANKKFECCQVCGGELTRELIAIRSPDRFELHVGIEPAGYVRRWMECDRCGAAINVYSGMVKEKLQRLAAGYYEVDFKGTTIDKKYEFVMALPPERSDNAMRVARVHRFLEHWMPNDQPYCAKALDIGAGTGVFLAKFLTEATRRGQRWEPNAVEPDPLAAAHLRRLGMFQVTEGLFTPGPSFEGFDLCTLNKVVEHLADPVELLRQAGTVLSSNRGVLYVEVPAKETIDCRPTNDNILGALHRQLYDIGSLNTALTRAGLEVIQVERIYEPSGKISIVGFAVRNELIRILRDGGLK